MSRFSARIVVFMKSLRHTLIKRLEFFLLVFIPALISSFVLFWVWNTLERRYVGQMVSKTLEEHRQFARFLEEQQQFVQQSLEKGSRALSPAPSSSYTPSPVSKQKTLQSPVPQLHVTEDQLWDALLLYRQEQNRTSLVHEESLCAYARLRVKELEQRLATLKESDSPLDGHAGFKRDADSGILFTQTGFPALAENLAYLPEYKTATQIIEWGWDSSAPHREAQLGNEWTHACVVGTYPFYMALFAHR